MQRSFRGWIGWWYVSIGLGFLLLAIYNALIGGQLWLVGIRVVLAIGFALLGYMELRSKRKRR